MIVMKAIRPAKLKDKAFRLEFLNAMRREATKIKRDYEQTTATWEHKVKFEEAVSLTGPGPVLLVDTNDEIYGYVDKGTKAHDIWADYYTGKSDKKTLAFAGTFTAKTVPGVLGSGAGSRSKVDTFTPYVRHPGTKARDFSKLIQRIWEPKFKRAMEEAMRNAAKDSGHAIK